MNDETINPGANTDQQQSTFSIQKIYVKDVSFESPGAPESFVMDGGYKPGTGYLDGCCFQGRSPAS